MILHGLRIIYYRGYEHHFRFNYLLLVLQIFVLVCLLSPLVVVYRNLT